MKSDKGNISDSFVCTKWVHKNNLVNNLESARIKNIFQNINVIFGFFNGAR